MNTCWNKCVQGRK